MIITKHGEQRIIERVGIQKASVRRHVKNVLKKGYRINEAPEPLELWLKCEIRYPDDEVRTTRVFGNYVYLFSKYNQLITVILIPTSVRQDVNRLNKGPKQHWNHPEDDYSEYNEDDLDDDYYEDGWLS